MGYAYTGYRDSRRIGALAAVAATLLYVPDLLPVGSKSTYWPRDTSQDARALNFLGYMSDAALSDHPGSMGSQSADMNNEVGAWDPGFRAAVTRFQAAENLTADSWIGPQTRTRLALKVTQRNASGLGASSVPALPSVVVPVNPGAVPALPTVLPGIVPASETSASEDNTVMYVGIAAGVLALGGLAYYAWA